MSRTAGNTLVTIEVGGEKWYFPEPYIKAMSSKSLGPAQIAAVQERWVAIMKAAGYTPEMVKNNKATIVSSAVNAFKQALSETIAKADSSVSTASSTGSGKTATVATAGKFKTDKDHFFGLERMVPPHVLSPKLKFKYIDGSDEMAERARIFAAGEIPLLFVGEAGVGKTAEVYHYGEELGWGVIRMGHDAHTEVEDILGKMVKRADGSIGYEYGPLARAVRDGLIYLADEINALKAGPLMVYQMINEAGADLVLTNNNGEVIPRHKNFRWVGTMNPTSYAGTNELNLAQLGRPYVFNVDYPDEAKEAKILASNFPTLDKNVIKNLVRFASEVRARKKKDPENIVYSVSTRDLVKISKLITEMEFSVKRAVEICVINTVANLGDKAETDAVTALVGTRF
jgi:MoxR-like ATPase